MRGSPKLRAVAFCVAVFLAALAVFVATYEVTNDHFDRLSRAQQVGAFGDLPFRDFFDPGYFLTAFASAAVMKASKGSLLGELALNTGAMALGMALTWLLARRACGSVLVSLVATALTMLSFPRAYDFDKVLFFPLGLFLLWRYIDAPTLANRVALALGIVIAGGFRYDSAVYLVVATVVAITCVHAGTMRGLVRQHMSLVGLLLLFSTPVLAFLATHGGLADVVDQVSTYAMREGRRTLVAPASIAVPALQEPLALVQFSLTPDAAAAVLYVALTAAPLLGLACLGWKVHRGAERADVARGASAVVLLGLLDVFVLRDPVVARVGGLAAPLAILAAWVCGAFVNVPRAARVLAGVVVVVGVASALSVSARWERRLNGDALSWTGITRKVRFYGSSRDAIARVIGNDRLPAIADYLKACTGPSDRALVGWYAPEVYYFSERGFAGGLAVVFGEHWSEERFQRRIVETLKSQRVPLVILQGYGVPRDFDYLDEFIRERYRLDGASNFGDDPPEDPRGYLVLVDKTLTSVRVHPQWGVACLR